MFESVAVVFVDELATVFRKGLSTEEEERKQSNKRVVDSMHLILYKS